MSNGGKIFLDKRHDVVKTKVDRKVVTKMRMLCLRNVYRIYLVKQKRNNKIKVVR